MFVGIRHCGWTLQRDSVRTPAGRKHWWNILHWQRSAIRYLLQDVKTYFSNVWWSQPLGICKYKYVTYYVNWLFCSCLLSNILLLIANCYRKMGYAAVITTALYPGTIKWTHILSRPAEQILRVRSNSHMYPLYKSHWWSDSLQIWQEHARNIYLRWVRCAKNWSTLTSHYGEISFENFSFWLKWTKIS